MWMRGAIVLLLLLLAKALLRVFFGGDGGWPAMERAVVTLPLLAWLLSTILRFATANADLTLLSKSAPKRGAFKDKVVWITGASQGFGEKLAQDFASHGAKLILSSRRISELERVKASLAGRNLAHDVVVLPFDVTGGETRINEAIAKAESAFDGHGVDIMVHNAAYPRPNLGILDVSDKETQAAFSVNLFGPVTLTRLLAPKMVQRGRGHFVVVSSAAGKVPSPGQSVYSATKFAVQGYFGCLRNELGYAGIKVTLLCLGPIAIDFPVKDRQPVAKCVELTIKAIFHELEEAWIMMHPILALCYLQQAFPSLASRVLQKVGPKRVKLGNTYSLGKLMKKDT